MRAGRMPSGAQKLDDTYSTANNVMENVLSRIDDEDLQTRGVMLILQKPC
jgi:hypothetical protein